MNNDDLLEMLKASAKSNQEPTATSFNGSSCQPLPIPKRTVTHTPRAGSRRFNPLVYLVLAGLAIGGLSFYRGPMKNPTAATGAQLAAGQHDAGERLTVSAYFDRYLPTTNGQVKWKLVTKDGYPLTVVVDQGLVVPIKMRAGRPIQLTVTPIGPQVASLRSAQDVHAQPDYDHPYEYVGVFFVTQEEGFGKLPTGEEMRFHAAGFENGTYNYLKMGFDAHDEAVALELKTIDDPDSLRSR